MKGTASVKLPNLKLHETQASFSVLLSVVGLGLLGLLGVFVFKNFNFDNNVILVGSKGTFSKIRQPGVLGLTALTVLLTGIGAIMGFNSLGQKRNKKQTLSWIGMFAGTIIASLAVVFLVAWLNLKETVL